MKITTPYMLLTLKSKYKLNIIYPHTQCNRKYFLYFTQPYKEDEPLIVVDSEYIINSMFYVGIIKNKSLQEIGFIFYSTNKTKYSSKYVVAYTNNYKISKTLDMKLCLKLHDISILAHKNKAVLLTTKLTSSDIIEKLCL